MPMFARWRVVLLLALLVGLLSPAPAAAASPAETMEGFFDRANAILRGADRARGIEEPRLAIRQLVNEMIEFREAAALALGAAWFSKPRETQAEFIELFTGVLERGFVAAIATKANVAGGVKIQYVGESVSGSRTTAPSSAASCVTIRTPV